MSASNILAEMFIGLLVTACDEDIVADVLKRSEARPDALYVLDGSDTRAHLPLVNGYWRDEEVPYSGHMRCGWRQFLYEKAVADHGYDHWFLILHSDEVWTFEPRRILRHWPRADVLRFRASCYFPREGEEWDYETPALDQLKWNLGPGWDEARMFHGNPKAAYEPSQHFVVTPKGLNISVQTELEIKHYPFRSPESQRRRAELHKQTEFNLGNHQHVLDGHVYWDDERIAQWQQYDCFRELRHDS